MKRMKKILAMLMASTMVLGMAMTANAADPKNPDGIVGTEDDKGTITVSGIEAENGITVTAYPIVKATYDGNSNFNGYDVVYDSVNPVIDLEKTYSNGAVEIGLDHLNAIIAAKNTQDAVVMTSQNGTYTADVPVGAYLVEVSGAEAKVYSPIVVSVNYQNKDGDNAINGGAVNVIADGNAWIKESDVPTFTKTERDVSGDKTAETDFGNSVNVGSEIEYTLTIKPIPYYGGAHPVLNIVDTLDEGLTYVEGSLTVGLEQQPLSEGGFEANKDYTFTKSPDGKTLTVDFVVGGNYTLNDYADPANSIVITYKATLNENAKIAATNDLAKENVNTAVLNYTKDSKYDIDDVKETLEEKTYTYTFDIKNALVKTDEEKKPLGGAEFGLFTDAACETPYINGLDNDGLYITDTNGKLEIKGLEAGTYYLKEVKAPAGYSVNTTVFPIVISASYVEEATEGKDQGQLESLTITVKDTPITQASFEIPNTKLVSLPSTGGIGTTIFTVAGCGIMIAAAFFFFKNRKKEEN